jgi:hypothetical protein
MEFRFPVAGVPRGQASWGRDVVVRSTVQERVVDRMGGRGEAVAEFWSVVIAVVITVAVGLVLPWEPERVSVTVANPTDHLIYVTTSTPTNASLTQVIAVPPRSATTADDVIDRGSQWVLHFRTRGASAGTLETSRSELLGGSFTIPTWINDELAARGVPPDVTDSEPDG